MLPRGDHSEDCEPEEQTAEAEKKNQGSACRRERVVDGI